MFCAKCGIPASANTNFCANCGDSLSQALLISTDGATTTSGYFFTTSTLKLVLMSICTAGVYELYWFYKNWVLIKKRTGQNIMPFWRAFFSPIWAYSCFNHIKTTAANNDIQASLSTGFLAITYFILQGLWRLPDPYWLISFLSFLPVLPANTLALKLNKQLISGFQNNTKFTGWNWVGLVLGGLLILLSIVGAFIPLENA
jgi:hypothetical protein